MDIKHSASEPRIAILLLAGMLVAGCATSPQRLEGSLELGNGQLSLEDGSQWQGQVSAAKPEGFGTMTNPANQHISGYWRDNLVQGQAVLRFPEADSIYLGTFAANKRAGFGRFITNRSTYAGYWTQDVPQGFGAFQTKGGKLFYAGHWHQGLRWGTGLSVDKKHGNYRGEWKKNLPTGFGESVGSSGSWYQGSWLDGKKHGYGTSMDGNGVTYEGNWENNTPHGYGVESWIDGNRYEGEWRAGEKYGFGTVYLANGGWHAGQWVGNKPKGEGRRYHAAGYSISGFWDADLIYRGEVLLEGVADAIYSGALRLGDKAHPELIDWLKARSGEGSAAAALLLVQALEWGKQRGTVPEAEIRDWLRLAATSQPEAAFQLAQRYLDDADNQNLARQALPLLQQAAAADHADAHLLLGNLYYKGELVGRNQQAAKNHFSAAARAGSLAARNNLAWLLATSAKDQLRDGEQALALILPLARQLPSPQHLDTLAAVYAESGQFELAVSIQRQALKRATGQAEFDVSDVPKRLELYNKSQPWRE